MADGPSLARLLAEVSFLQSAAKVSELPGGGTPEIAIAGRSNAGKSTALNVLCQRRKLAFASKTPGRTRLINLFALSCLEQDVGRLVDLPGYGYAKVDAQTQRRWKAELSRYLESRPNLVGLILVSDIRHALGPLDQQMLDWFGPRGLPVHVLLTKADKLNRQEQTKALQAALTQIQNAGPRWGGGLTASTFSGLKRTGREPVLERITDWLGLTPPALAAASAPATPNQEPTR